MSNRRRVRGDWWEIPPMTELLIEAICSYGVKQEPPEMAISEGSTDRKTLLEVPGGCSPDCA